MDDGIEKPSLADFQQYLTAKLIGAYADKYSLWKDKYIPTCK